VPQRLILQNKVSLTYFLTTTYKQAIIFSFYANQACNLHIPFILEVHISLNNSQQVKKELLIWGARIVQIKIKEV
jgi:hypothetical protein